MTSAGVDVRIGANAGAACEYRLAEDRAARLVAVHPPAGQDVPGDIGEVVDSADPADEPLRAIVLSRVSAHPGAVVSGRVIGLVRADDGAPGWLVVAPVVDEELAAVQAPADLPAGVAERLRAFLGGGHVDWMQPAESQTLARAAIDRGRRLKAQQRAERAAAEAAWTPTAGAQRRWATFEGESHTLAELELVRAQYRFQLYLREVLLPPERLLASVHRRRLAVGHWPFRREVVPEAVLLLTDQELLVLQDAQVLDATVGLGGFVARATAVERIADVRLESTSELATLRVALQSVGGDVPWSILAEPSPELEALARQTACFVPRPDERLLARSGSVDPAELDATGWDTFFSPDVRADWTERVDQALQRDEPLLAWALAPPMPSDGRRWTAAVALTPNRLVVLSDAASATSWPLGQVTSLEIRSSPFASGLRVWTDGASPALTMPFPFTVGPAFLDLFLALRRRLTAGLATQLATPPPAAGHRHGASPSTIA